MVNRNIRFSHLHQHNSISCEYKRKYGVVRTIKVCVVSYIFNNMIYVENHMFSSLQFPGVLNSFICSIYSTV